MSQTDLNVANASGAVVRADLNDHFQALATNSGGATAPTTTFPHQWWFDESTNDLNQRNAGNTAWVLIARKDGSGWTPYRQGTLLGILATKNSNVLAKTGAYTVVVADDGKLIDGDATTAAFSVTLPTVASAGDGFIVAVKKTDSSANAVTVDAAGAEFIDGATTKVLSDQFASVVMYCDGVEWHIASEVEPAAAPASFPTGTSMLFQQTAAPTGWTKQSTHNNKAIRLQTGAVTTGGANPFTTVFGTGKATASHTLAIGEIAAHTHQVGSATQIASSAGADSNPAGSGAVSSSSAGGGGGHTHNLSNLDLLFVDFIIANKDA